jgi:hypothetical protein
MRESVIEQRPREIIASFAGILIGIVACMGAGTLGYDQGCVVGADNYLPVYPNAELVSSEYDSFRPFGIGSTVRVYYSDDPVQVVRDWYVEERTQAARDAKPRGLGNYAYRAVLDPNDGDGTQISLLSDCVPR